MDLSDTDEMIKLLFVTCFMFSVGEFRTYGECLFHRSEPNYPKVCMLLLTLRHKGH